MRNQTNILSFDEAKASRAFSRSRSGGRTLAAGESRGRFGEEKARRPKQDSTSDRSESQKKKATLFSKIKEQNRKRAKKKAGKKFERQFESKPSNASQSGPRAAVYKGEMGSSHKRASRMQRNEESSKKATWSRSGKSKKHTFSSKKAVAGIAVAVCLLFTGAFLYQPAQQYYHAVRERDRLQAELMAVEQRNGELEGEIAFLESDSGVEDRARDELGWVMPGENAVIVRGIGHTTGSQRDLGTAGNIIPGSIEAPETWYSPFCDVIFGKES